ncbi:hypothetical protein T492DRAFT_835889 [Pavlovales sp. CCMP2436]|nr:hypothetical protein T492DRAFT_835889 [Pavlovales sp. CCMP2436]
MFSIFTPKKTSEPAARSRAEAPDRVYKVLKYVTVKGYIAKHPKLAAPLRRLGSIISWRVWLHLIIAHTAITCVIFGHFFMLQFYNRASDALDSRYYWARRLIPSLEFGSMHAVLFQFALLPITMARHLITSTGIMSTSSLHFVHIHLGYVVTLVITGAVIIVLVFFGVMCHNLETEHTTLGTETFCDKFKSEIAITGYCVLFCILTILITGNQRNSKEFRHGRVRSQTFHWLATSFLVYILDRVYRHMSAAWMAQGAPPTLTITEEHYSLTLRLEREMRVLPGDWTQLRVPSISAMAHPFSVMQGPTLYDVVYFIKSPHNGPGDKTTPFCRALIEAVAGKNNQGPIRRNSTNGTLGKGKPRHIVGKLVPMAVMGPYNSNFPAVAGMDGVVCVGLGSGVVPCLSVFLTAIRSCLRGHNVKIPDEAHAVGAHEWAAAVLGRHHRRRRAHKLENDIGSTSMQTNEVRQLRMERMKTPGSTSPQKQVENILIPMTVTEEGGMISTFGRTLQARCESFYIRLATPLSPLCAPAPTSRLLKAPALTHLASHPASLPTLIPPQQINSVKGKLRLEVLRLLFYSLAVAAVSLTFSFHFMPKQVPVALAVSLREYIRYITFGLSCVFLLVAVYRAAQVFKVVWGSCLPAAHSQPPPSPHPTQPKSPGGLRAAAAWGNSGPPDHSRSDVVVAHILVLTSTRLLGFKMPLGFQPEPHGGYVWLWTLLLAILPIRLATFTDDYTIKGRKAASTLSTVFPQRVQAIWVLRDTPTAQSVLDLMEQPMATILRTERNAIDFIKHVSITIYVTRSSGQDLQVPYHMRDIVEIKTGRPDFGQRLSTIDLCSEIETKKMAHTCVFYCGNKTASNEVSHAVFSENVVASLADIPHRMSFAGESFAAGRTSLFEGKPPGGAAAKKKRPATTPIVVQAPFVVQAKANATARNSVTTSGDRSSDSSLEFHA